MDIPLIVLEPGRRLLEHPEAEILEHRHDVGKRHQAAEAVDFQAKLALRVGIETIETNRALAVVRQGVEPQRVIGGILGGIAGAIGGREGRGVGDGEAGRAVDADQLGQLGLDRRRPAADHLVQLPVERLGVGRLPVGVDGVNVTDEREVAIAEVDRPVGLPAACRLGDHVADRHPPPRRQLVARQPDEGEQMPLQDRADQGQRRARPVGQRHRGDHQRADLLGPEVDQQIVRQRHDGVTQRLAAMALRGEAEPFVELGQALAEHRDVLDRRVQRLAGPQADMDADADDLAVLAHRYRDQVERHPAMDRRLEVALGHQRNRAALLEIADRALAAAFVGRLIRQPEDAEALDRFAARALDLEAEQGHRAVGEPVEQRAPLFVLDPVGILAHALLHRLPVGDRSANGFEDALELVKQLAAGAGVGAIDLDIHDRLAPLAILAQRLDLGKAAFVVAAHADHRVEQPVDDQAARGDRPRHRIDQEGHVVIGDADPHAPPAELRAERFQRGRGRCPGGRREAHCGDERGGRACILLAEILELAGKGALPEDIAEAVDQGHVGTIAGHRVAGATARGSGLGPGDIVGVHRSAPGTGTAGQGPAFRRAYRPALAVAARLRRPRPGRAKPRSRPRAGYSTTIEPLIPKVV